MKTWIIRLAVAGVLAAGVTATAALAVIPANGGDAASNAPNATRTPRSDQA